LLRNAQSISIDGRIALPIGTDKGAICLLQNKIIAGMTGPATTLAAGVSAALLVSGCHPNGADEAQPPYARALAVPPPISSAIAVPVSTDLASLQRLLDREIPRTLWSIEKDDVTCVKPQSVSILGARVAIAPALKCRIVGSARSGAIVLHGDGENIRADLPIIAEVHVEKIAGVLGATATGTAMAHARIRLAVSPDWQPSGTIRLDYDWQTAPSVVIMGQRIAFTDKADEKLRPILARLEQRLPGELAKLDLRQKIARVWASGFAVLKLNDEKPPVWMRIVPQRLGYGGYDITGNRLVLRLGMVALTQAVIGARPAAPAPSPLPPMTREPVPDGQVKVFAPVLADYDELKPVIERALVKRSQRPFTLPGIGAVTAKFANITVYGATDGRIAVGADVTAEVVDGKLAPTHGRIWFAAVPHNDTGSQIIRFSNLKVGGQVDRTGGNLALSIAGSNAFSQAIADALQQNVGGDFGKLLVKIRTAIAHREQGDLQIDARLDSAVNGQIEAFANGLYLPVWLNGQAQVRYEPK
jgi:hypothetical protein